MKRWRKAVHVASWTIFTVYLVGLVYFLFFCEGMGRVPGNEYRYSLVPLKEIKRYLVHWQAIGSFHAALNLFGNVICFIPFGAVLPVISERQRKLGRITVLSFLSSLLIELIQLVSRVGSCDVDDILLNTLGGICGYFIFWCSYRLFCKFRKEKKFSAVMEERDKVVRSAGESGQSHSGEQVIQNVP